MSRLKWFVLFGVAGLLAGPAGALAQSRPYIGFAYPSGGQQGTTIQVRLGGQALDDVNGVVVTGPGISGRIVHYFRNFNPQDMQLISEQLRELKKATATSASSMMSMMTMGMNPMMASAAPGGSPDSPCQDEETMKMISRIEKRMAEYCNRPASSSIANIAIAELTIAPDAPPGQRELRVITPRGGASNPLVFCVGQLPEVSRKPMSTANFQVLGKEELALRKRPADEIEDRIVIPCTMNGQIASGEVNRYRFEARKGQKLVITSLARQLVPYVADAVPGWFQPIMVVYDAKGKEVAYGDDYRFKPDPTILFEVPATGEYVLGIYDAIYRGREDFVYRLSIGETPFITSIFPLGSKVGEPVDIKMKGWNLEQAQLQLPSPGTGAGTCFLAAIGNGAVTNQVPYALGSLPECKEAKPGPKSPQKVQLPVVINGKIEVRDDWDVFQFAGRAGETVVVEVSARRLDSPLDSVLKLTDASGKLIGFSDDREDLGAGTNTHHADSYILAKLPADGDYFVHLGDTARNGGDEYGYRLRIGPPIPDFELRAVPSSVALRSKGAASATIQIIRKDGFNAPIKLTLKDPPPGFMANPVTLAATQEKVGFTVKTDLVETRHPVSLSIIGTAKIGDQEIVRQAVPAEDRMQAFLWRHLVPAQEFQVMVYDPNYVAPPKRTCRYQTATTMTTPQK